MQVKYCTLHGPFVAVCQLFFIHTHGHLQKRRSPQSGNPHCTDSNGANGKGQNSKADSDLDQSLRVPPGVRNRRQKGLNPNPRRSNNLGAPNLTTTPRPIALPLPFLALSRREAVPRGPHTALTAHARAQAAGRQASPHYNPSTQLADVPPAAQPPQG